MLNLFEPISWLFPKGSLENQMQRFFEQLGFTITWQGYKGCIDNMRFVSKTSPLVKMRPQDIPRYVVRGNFDIGITGQDCVLENGLKENIVEICHIPLTRNGNKEISIAVFVERESRIESIHNVNVRRIATEYPNITKQYLEKHGISASVDVCHGATEAIVASGCADVGIDVMDSGTTIQKNGLKIIDKVMVSSAVLVANCDAYANPEKRATIEWLKRLINS